MKFKLFDLYPNLWHTVTEKRTQESCGFSLALHTGEPEVQIKNNRAVLAAQAGKESHFVGVRQVHSDKIHVVTQHKAQGWSTLSDTVEADALVTNLPGVVLTILTADCVPILLYDPLVGTIGAVHAGWKGTQAEILPKTIAKMQEKYGSKPQDILIAIGPAIGQCCYEVGEEVARHFADYVGAVIVGKVAGKYQLDLKRVNQLQALESDIITENMEVTPLCTSCAKDRFFSYRAEQGCSGRFLSAIKLM